MRWLALLAVVIGFSSIPAAAKPLPDGLEVKLTKGKVMAKRGTTSVQINSASKLISVELSADGKTIVMKVPGNVDMGEDPEIEDKVSLASVEGKLANAAGMSFQLKKKYADAVGPFTTAVQNDPQPVYITNLLSALSMGKKLDDADKVMATHGKRIAPWLAWRLAVDKELAALVGRPATKALFPGGGKATSNLAGGELEKVAYSAAGFAAAEVYTNLSMGIPDRSEKAIAFVNLATGEEVLRLPTETTCNEGIPGGGGCKTKSFAAANKKQRKVADAVLAQMAFEVSPEPLIDLQSQTSAVAKDGRKLVDGKDGRAIEVGKKHVPFPADIDVRELAFVPKAVVLVHKVSTSSNEDGTGTWEFELTSVLTP